MIVVWRDSAFTKCLVREMDYELISIVLLLLSQPPPAVNKAFQISFRFDIRWITARVAQGTVYKFQPQIYKSKLHLIKAFLGINIIMCLSGFD